MADVTGRYCCELIGRGQVFVNRRENLSLQVEKSILT